MNPCFVMKNPYISPNNILAEQWKACIKTVYFNIEEALAGQKYLLHISILE